MKLNFKTLTTSRRYLSLAVIAGLVTAGIVIGVIIPQIQRILEIQALIAKERKVVAALERKALELEGLPSSTILTRSNRIDLALPSQKPLLQLLTSLNEVGAQTGVVFDEISLSPGAISTESATLKSAISSGRPAASTRARSGPYEELSVNIVVRGTLNQVNAFIRQTEQTTPVSTVTSLALQKIGNSTEVDPQFESEIIVTTYYFTQSISAAIEAELPKVTAQEEAVITQLDTFISPGVAKQDQIVGGGLVDLFRLNNSTASESAQAL